MDPWDEFRPRARSRWHMAAMDPTGPAMLYGGCPWSPEPMPALRPSPAPRRHDVPRLAAAALLALAWLALAISS